MLNTLNLITDCFSLKTEGEAEVSFKQATRTNFLLHMVGADRAMPEIVAHALENAHTEPYFASCTSTVHI